MEKKNGTIQLYWVEFLANTPIETETIMLAYDQLASFTVGTVVELSHYAPIERT